VKLSKGEFLAFLDVDDWWEKDKLRDFKSRNGKKKL
jgi:hypothetical protein